MRELTDLTKGGHFFINSLPLRNLILSSLYVYVPSIVFIFIGTELYYLAILYLIFFILSLHTTTPSIEYYASGSPQHAIKVKNKVDSENRIKVYSVSVLYSRDKKK